MNDNKHSNVCLNKTHELHALRIRIGSIFLRTIHLRIIENLRDIKINSISFWNGIYFSECFYQ